MFFTPFSTCTILPDLSGVRSRGGGQGPARGPCVAQKPSLRLVSMEELEREKGRLCGSDAEGEVIYRRAKHVITENDRTQAAAHALKDASAASLHRFGELMLASHRSLQHDYEVHPHHLILLHLAGTFDFYAANMQ